MTQRPQLSLRHNVHKNRLSGLVLAWCVVLAAVGLFLGVLTIQDWMLRREGYLPRLSLPVLAQESTGAEAWSPKDALEAAVRVETHPDHEEEPEEPSVSDGVEEAPTRVTEGPSNPEKVSQPPHDTSPSFAPAVVPTQPLTFDKPPQLAPLTPLKPLATPTLSAGPVSKDVTPTEPKKMPSVVPPIASLGAPKPAGKRPRVSLIVSGLGLQQKALTAAMQDLPPVVTLAFVPYAPGVVQLINAARQGDHEVLLTVPLEPKDFPKGDPGPYTLLTGVSSEENQRRLMMMLDSGQGYVGLVAFLGSKFLESPAAIQGLLRPLKDRNLLFVTNEQAGLGPLLTAAKAEDVRPIIHVVELDKEASGAAIDAQLDRMVVMAKEKGYAVGIAHAYPISINRVTAWATKVEDRGVDIVPITQVAL